MDLNEPLGVHAPPPKSRRRLLVVVMSGLVGLAVAGTGLFLATADPRGGQPYVVVSIPPPLPRPEASPAPTMPDTTPTGSLPKVHLDPAASNAPVMPSVGSMEGGVKVFRGGLVQQTTRDSTGPLVIDVTKELDNPLGKRSTATAGTVVTSGTTSASQAPRVALFVSGMGLSESATRIATETMPPAVDLAFVPYGEKLAAAVAAAKARGHEILLQLPMQNAQGLRPGPHALEPDEPATTLSDDLAWLMDRFGGYVGVTNLLGGPVTANAATMAPILKAVAARGLFYVDDGTSSHSAAPALAPEAGLPAMQADVVLDATSDPAVVRANLDRLVAVAKRNGHAIGMASGLQEHLGEIARFAADLGGKGVVLVPVSALKGHDASVATAR